MFGRFPRLARSKKEVGKVIVGVGVIGLQFDGAMELSHGFVWKTFPRESIAEIVVSDFVIRLKLQDNPKFGDGLVGGASSEQGGAEVVVGEIRAWVVQEGGAPEGFRIAINPALAPGEDGEQEEEG